MHYLKINDSDKKKIGYLIHLYRTQFCVLLNPCNIYIIWLFIQLFLVLFYIPNHLCILCTHFGVTVSTY